MARSFFSSVGSSLDFLLDFHSIFQGFFSFFWGEGGVWLSLDFGVSGTHSVEHPPPLAGPSGPLKKMAKSLTVA